MLAFLRRLFGWDGSGSGVAPPVYVAGDWPRFNVRPRAIYIDVPERTTRFDVRRRLRFDVPRDGVRVP